MLKIQRPTAVITNEPFFDNVFLVASFLDPNFKFYWIDVLTLAKEKIIVLKDYIIKNVFDECLKNAAAEKLSTQKVADKSQNKPIANTYKQNSYITSSSSTTDRSRKKSLVSKITNERPRSSSVTKKNVDLHIKNAEASSLVNSKKKINPMFNYSKIRAIRRRRTNRCCEILHINPYTPRMCFF